MSAQDSAILALYVAAGVSLIVLFIRAVFWSIGKVDDMGVNAVREEWLTSTESVADILAGQTALIEAQRAEHQRIIADMNERLDREMSTLPASVDRIFTSSADWSEVQDMSIATVSGARAREVAANMARDLVDYGADVQQRWRSEVRFDHHVYVSPGVLTPNYREQHVNALMHEFQVNRAEADRLYEKMHAQVAADIEAAKQPPAPDTRPPRAIRLREETQHGPGESV